MFDPSVGLIVRPVQFGSDSGVNHSIEITQDAIKGGGLNNGTQYYFSVTAYSYDPNGAPKTLENTQGVAGFETNTVAIIPQKPIAGVDLGTAEAEKVANDFLGGLDKLKPLPLDRKKAERPDGTMDWLSALRAQQSGDTLGKAGFGGEALSIDGQGRLLSGGKKVDLAALDDAALHALFGAAHYPVIMGRLAFPSLIAQALAPTLGALMIERAGAPATLAWLAIFAAVNAALMLVLWRLVAAGRGEA